MDLYVKINNIKNCKLSNDLSIPFGLYYNKNIKNSPAEIPIICNKGGLVCEKMFNKFLDEVCIDNTNTKTKKHSKKYTKKHTKKHPKKQTKKQTKKHIKK